MTTPFFLLADQRCTPAAAPGALPCALRAPPTAPDTTSATFDFFSIFNSVSRHRFYPKFVSRKIGGGSEVNRPDRAMRRSKGKSDPTDAENAARAVLSGRATAIPKEQSGAAEAMRAVSVARRRAVKAKTQAINQLRALLVSAPQDIRDRLLKAKTAECVESCARVRSLGKTLRLQTLTATLRLLAKRWLTLAEELKALDTMLDSLTTQHARRLRERFGVGPQTAAVLVAVAGDNPERLNS